jgi:raffinose/stachyose/melibiose transport system substrate-binding protein
MDQLWPNPKVQQTMLTGIQEVFSKQSTPDKVLAAMDTDYKSGA